MANPHKKSTKKLIPVGQDKGIMCACGCGERKTGRKMKFLPGHNQTRRDTRYEAKRVENANL